MQLPLSIQRLVEEFAKLPTIGRKSAERFVFYLLQRPQAELDSFSESMKNLKEQVTLCSVCGCFSEKNPCEICDNNRRDQTSICVVVETKNIILIEKTKIFNGTYHVLNGVIDMVKGIRPEHLNIQKLIERVEGKNTQEVILALNPTFEGETTALYLKNLLQKYNIKITRLARGLPSGAEIEYADEKTLSEALKHRF